MTYTYAEQVTLVEEAGWVVRRLTGKHLHLLDAPDGVADTLLTVRSELKET